VELDSKVASVLNRLEERSKSERARLEELRKQGGTALREVAADFMLDIGPVSGVLLNSLVRSSAAKRIVEVGGSVGYSTVWLAEAARATGGKILTFELEASKREQMEQNLKDAGLLSYVEIRGDDIQKYAANIPAPIDILFLDHWKELYIREFKLLWPKIRSGGMIISDNIIRPEKNKAVIAEYLNYIKSVKDARSATVDVGDGLEITCKE